MITRLAALLCATAFALPAVAQSPVLAQNNGYDPGRACRVYVLQKLPVPVRCLAELLGNWSAHPYIDGEFMFRNREQYLQWRDRDDYRRWKNHDYNASAGLPPAREPPPVMPLAAQPAPAQPGAALLCPADISARLVPTALQGWTANDGAVTLRLDGVPRAEGGTLTCSYGPGHVTLTRPAWGRCTVRPDGKGFDCTP